MSLDHAGTSSGMEFFVQSGLETEKLLKLCASHLIGFDA